MNDRTFVRALFALVGFFVGFMIVVPLGCTARDGAITEGRSETRPSVGDTSCSSAIGIDYSGSGNYNPPLWPAVVAGLLTAAAVAALASLPQIRRREQMKPRTLGWIGVGLHGAWTLFLSVLGLFSDGSLDPQWSTALVFVLLVGAPVAVAIFGLRGRPALLLTAGVICVPLSFISLAGATIPLLLPALFYMGAYMRTPMSEQRDRSSWASPPPEKGRPSPG